MAYVVEGPVLRDYYNKMTFSSVLVLVVEGPVLRDYYNSPTILSP